MKRLRAKFGVFLVTGLVGGSLGLTSSTPVGAHFAESKISLHADDHRAKGQEKITFFGRLRNTHKKCRANEEVLLKRRGQGVVDVDVTDADGEFRFRHDPQPNRGRFFARYRGKGRFGYGQGHRCSGAVSEIVRIRRQRRN